MTLLRFNIISHVSTLTLSLGFSLPACLQVYQPENKKLSRASKELAALAPWAWDPNVNKRPPGRAMLRDFAEVRRRQAHPRVLCAFQ